MSQPPRLSVVATSRNDDHGGHLVERMQWFVDGLAWNADRRAISTELVMVEWNPPAGRPPLADVLRWPEATSALTARVLTVDAGEHRRLRGEGGIPMLQMIAKNVGIRRAHGTNVLATNIDILLAPSLFDLAVSRIGTGTLWRADRYDVEFPFAADVVTLEAAYAFCEAHPVRFERRDGVYYPGLGRRLPIYQSLGDLVGWQLRQGAHRLPAIGRAAVGRARDDSADPPRPAAHRPANASSLAELVRFARGRLEAARDFAVLPKLNVNACGDFTLLSAQDWARLRGYPEWVLHSLHLDTVLLHQAHAAGLNFVDLDAPSVAYHMEHEAGSGWTPEAQSAHLASVAGRGMPYLSPEALRKEKLELWKAHRRGSPVVYNDASWGLSDAAVTEWVPHTPAPENTAPENTAPENTAPENTAPERRCRRSQEGTGRSSGSATTS